MNYFQLFDLPTDFTVDLNQLSSRYQTLQKAVHPDKFAHASEQEQRIAVQKSAEINDAYQTLKKPLQRAEYLLVDRGIEMPNEQHSFSDTGFLMRQMELREMLAEVKFSDNPEAALSAVQNELESEHQSLFALLQTQLSENTPESNRLACDNLRKLKFYQKLTIEVERLEESLFDD
ncbi:co-chaperone HscB [Colwellia sp. D2M02]|uniref:Co-chaperone protein HscB homolog n=1 Tax=Colwellia asteriadis TaxID=517723 RepID=A0ABN1L215_9GAMM|nr:co-chaperone HscB [Colwellia sp. D2M02]